MFVLLVALLDRPGSPAGPPWLALGVGGGLATITGVLLTRRGLARETVWLTSLLCLLVAQRAVVSWLSLEPYASLVNLSGWVVALALYLTLLAGVQNSDDWRRFAGAAIMLALALSVWAFGSYAPNGPVASFANPDTLALIPLTSAFLCIGMLGGRADWVWWLLAAFLILAFLLVGGRTASGALLAGALTVFWLQRVRLTPPEAREGSLSGGVLFVGLAVLALFFVFVRPQLPSFAHVVGASDAERLRERRDVLWQAAALTTQRPLTGSGPGTFALAFQALQENEPEVVDSSQNDLMDLAVESGLLGSILWAWLLVATFFTAYTRALDVPDPSLPLDWSSVGALGALVVATTFSLLFSVVATPATLCWMATLLALAARSGQNAGAPPVKGPAPVALGLVLALAGLWVVSFSWRGGAAARECDRGERAAQALLLEESLAASRNATSLAPGWWVPHYQAARALRLLALESGDPSLRTQAFDELQRARSCSPRELRILSLLAELSLEGSELERAARAYTDGLELAPGRRDFWRGLLGVRLQLAQLEEALPIALRLYADDPGVLVVASRVLLALSVRNPSQAARLLAQSELSDEQLEELLERTEASARPLALHAVAAALYAVWLDRHANDWSTRLRQARLLLEGGQKEAGAFAVSELRRLVPPQDPAAVEVLCTWAALASERGQGREVRSELQDYLQQNPTSLPVRRLLARLLLDSGDSEAAVAQIDEGLLADPDEPELLILKARILFERGSLDAALEYTGLVLAAHPENQEAAALREKVLRKISP